MNCSGQTHLKFSLAPWLQPGEEMPCEVPAVLTASHFAQQAVETAERVFRAHGHRAEATVLMNDPPSHGI